MLGVDGAAIASLTDAHVRTRPLAQPTAASSVARTALRAAIRAAPFCHGATEWASATSQSATMRESRGDSRSAR